MLRDPEKETLHKSAMDRSRIFAPKWNSMFATVVGRLFYVPLIFTFSTNYQVIVLTLGNSPVARGLHKKGKFLLFLYISSHHGQRPPRFQIPVCTCMRRQN